MNADRGARGRKSASSCVGAELGLLIGNLPLIETLSAIAAERPAFHSEADFQHHLAWVIRQLDPAVQVRLEIRPVPDLSLELDLLLIQPQLDDRVAVELKYATRALTVAIGGEVFRLRNQAAQDIRRHDFVKDLLRLETLIDRGVVNRGWALFLTNDPGFWRASTRTTVDAAFRLHEGQVLTGSLTWSEAAGAGTRLGRDDPLALAGSYPLHWIDFSTVAPQPAGIFRLLAVEVGSETPGAQLTAP